jgi:glycosyltransferase involved in cell wall biosynthesis
MMTDVGVDTGKFSLSPDRTTGSELTFLAAGRLETRKGMILLVEAFAAMAAHHPHTRLRIVGDGPERSRLAAAVASHGLKQRITLAGAVSHHEMRRQFDLADVFVFPSLRDTSGAVVLEAMAAGLPVICLDHQGVALMVADSCGIRILPGPLPETIDALAAGMRRLADHSEMRRQMGENARRRAVEEFSWDEKLERMLEIYETLGTSRPDCPWLAPRVN